MGAGTGTLHAHPPHRSLDPCTSHPCQAVSRTPRPYSTRGDGTIPPSAAGQRSPHRDPVPPSIPPGGSPASRSRPRSRAGRSRAAGARSSRDPPPPWHCGTGASAPGCPCSPGRHPGPAASAREAPASLCAFGRPRGGETCPTERPGMLGHAAGSAHPLVPPGLTFSVPHFHNGPCSPTATPEMLWRREDTTPSAAWAGWEEEPVLGRGAEGRESPPRGSPDSPAAPRGCGTGRPCEELSFPPASGNPGALPRCAVP